MAAGSQAARNLAQRMASEYLSALGFAVEPDDPVAEPFVRMLLPAAMVVTETQAKADELAARLDMHVSALSELMLLEAEERGEADIPDIPDFLPARWAGDAR